MNKEKIKELKGKPFYLNDNDIKWINDTLNNMNLDEKIGQLFHLIAYTSDKKLLNHMINDLHINGLMVRGGMSIEEVCELTNYLQKNSKIPCLISANLESGGNGCVKEGTQVGKQMQIGATNDVENAKILAHVCGEEASAIGVNWAFAPVSDIDLNWRNPITNTRLYGNDYKKVANYTTAYIKEVQRLGLLGCGKHFPGDGVDERDQHLVASVNSLSRDDWMKMYGHIYKTQIENGVKSIMIGHILQPAWEKYLTPGLKDKECMPGTLSKGLITGLLRGELGFKGLISTDATTMAGMTTMMNRELAVPTTIAIGCDCFLFTKDLDEDFAFMKKGYEKGIITKERLDDAVTNVLAAKASIGLNTKKQDGTIYKDPISAHKIVGCDEFKDDARKIADHCITLIKNEQNVLPISPKKYKKVLLYGLENKAPNVFGFLNDSIIDEFENKLKKEGFEVTRFSPQKALKEGALQSVKGMKDSYDLLMYCANLATKSNQTTVRIEWAIPFGTDVPAYVKEIPTVFVSLENPYHLVDVPRVETYINTYGGSEYIIDALVDKLCGRSDFKGIDPVDSFCGKWDTHL
ncbi:MAG: glycoside hydrolase family 3 N-terminal domain-containing protein [Bacilli bacterium]